MQKTIKINILYDKRGNTYAERNEQDCIDIVCKKLNVSTNPRVDDNYVKNVFKYQSIEKQVKEQYDCNLRQITFKINI